MRHYHQRQWLYREVNGTIFQLVEDDITHQEVDAIVTAANSRLAGGCGVDEAIHRAGGPVIMACCRQLGGCRRGDAVVTEAGNLKAKMVIHAVGPAWRGGDRDEDKLLRSAYTRSLEEAGKRVATSVAFPSLSTGSYGFPIDRAAPIAVRAVLDFLKGSHSVDLVRFVLYTRDDVRVYDDAAREILDRPDFGCWWDYFMNSPVARNDNFLHLGSSDGYGLAVAELVKMSEHVHWEEDTNRLLGLPNWRGHLPTSLSIYLSGVYRKSMLTALWSAVGKGSWVIPQLIAVLSQIDDQFDENVRRLVSGGLQPHQPDEPLKKHVEMGPGTSESRLGKAANSLLGLADCRAWGVDGELRDRLKLLAAADYDNADVLSRNYLQHLKALKAKYC